MMNVLDEDELLDEELKVVKTLLEELESRGGGTVSNEYWVYSRTSSRC